jgi:hypothetical protein
MKLRHLTTSALALVLMTACSDATGVEPADLAGTWTASSIVFTSVEDGTVTADLVTDGATLTLVFGADNTFTLTFTEPQEDDEVDTGTYIMTGSTLTLSDSIELTTDTYVIARDGDTMTLTVADEEYDFDDNGETPKDDATLVVTLTR